MKKSVSLKLIVFSFLLVGNTSAFSVPEIKEGSKTDSIIAGIDNTASEKWSSAFGHTNTASGEFSSAFGFWNKASREFSSAFGAYNTASGRESSAFGDNNTASGRESSAFGHLNLASGKNSLAFGNQYEVTGETSGAFGVGEHKGNGVYNYINEGNNSYMIGNFNKIASGSNDNFILGNKVSIGTGVQNSVVLGNGSASGGSNTVSVGSSSNKRKIVNVADGTADSDAATLGQVKNLIASGGSPDLTNDVNKLKTDMTNVKNDV
ncbi:hypothetical protein HMPREF1538_01140, partial [Fusobacterium nucleatum CTI-1]